MPPLLVFFRKLTLPCSRVNGFFWSQGYGLAGVRNQEL
jgi:hypothetical protein